MRNLFRFLLKQHFVLLFLLLEALSIFLLTRSHTYHRSAVINTTGSITGRLYETTSNISGYFKLRETNRSLAEQNAILQERLFYYEHYADTLFRKMPDSAGFDYIPAKVVSNSVNRRNNYIIINKGSRHGIEKEMGIISPNGVAGIIIGVSENYATALSVLHTHARLSVKFSKNNQLANLVWFGPDFRRGNVEDIPTHIEVNKGDTIVTSGHSFIFPEGIMVGTIEAFHRHEGRGLNDAELLFSTDFNRLRYVYVVSNKQLTEIEELKKMNAYE